MKSTGSWRGFALAAIVAASGAAACGGDYFYVAPAAAPPPAPPPTAEAPPPPPAPPKLIGAQLDIGGQIEFEDKKATLSDVQPTRDALNEVLKGLQNTPSLTKVRVEGHTDNAGNAAQNRKLSEARAQAVVKWLVENGIAASRLSAVGCGSKDPLGPNDTAEHRQRNRRIEFDVEQIDGKRPDAYTKPCAPNPARGH